MILSVFKTSVTKPDIPLITYLLRNEKNIKVWSFDFEDKDNVLRIESDAKISLNVIEILTKEGFVCKEFF